MLVHGVAWNQDKDLLGDPSTTKRLKQPQQQQKQQRGGGGVAIEGGRGGEGTKRSKGVASKGPGIEIDVDKAKGGASRGKFKFLRQQQQ